MNGQGSIKINKQQSITKSNDYSKIAVNEILKRVDQFIKKNDLENAESEVAKAKDLDPNNIYAFALGERISNLKAEFDRLEQSKKEQSSRCSQPKKNNAPNKGTKNSLHLITCNPKPQDSYVPTVQSYSDTIISNNDTKTIVKKEKEDAVKQNRNYELEAYRQAMLEAWSDGALTENEERQLSKLKALLEISDVEHYHSEKYVRLECYKRAIIQSITSYPTDTPDTISYIELRNTFKISEEEHKQILKTISNSIQPKQSSKILIIDDDARLLELIQKSLEENGFEVIALSTSDEALALLRKFTPDLILCDINLKTSTIGGFTFYERIQQFNHLREVPFIFLTGLTDDAFVQTGKELGVDDYLMKPISERMLISALRGKLKRFKQLKQILHSM